jgi:hypothetical protein
MMSRDPFFCTITSQYSLYFLRAFAKAAAKAPAMAPFPVGCCVGLEPRGWR